MLILFKFKHNTEEPILKTTLQTSHKMKELNYTDYRNGKKKKSFKWIPMLALSRDLQSLQD